MIAKNLLGLVALAAMLPVAAAAQDAATPPASAAELAEEMGGDTVTIGLGVGYMPDYEGSDDYQFTPVPGVIGSVGGVNFQVLGNRASADLIPNQPGPTWDFQAGPIGVVNFMRSNRSGIDDPRVRALGDLDTAIELGGYVGIGKTGVITSPYDKLSVSVSYRHDVTNTHGSGIWQPTINYFTPLSTKAAVALFGSAERVETKYLRTYFDVSPTQSVASGLPTYNGRGGWKSWTVGAMGTYSLTGNLLKGFKLIGGGTYRKLINDVGDSPIVRDAGTRNQWLGVLGLAYTF
ncbi:MipA/OmpV family protein [Sphingomonas jeddahensis]|uniref:MltA-interacting protein MipA n=1 Tax=Sphingomonas jeddahensis TaxID=1915074 RepID=A0A1V2EV06_9SPHN|nr:MipA/OmpV family protein [Sphingomonas jeddahensis]ONF96511.1 MltA-interacting protein MipA [Sphingomonas jeddahensis]